MVGLHGQVGVQDIEPTKVEICATNVNPPQDFTRRRGGAPAERDSGEDNRRCTAYTKWWFKSQQTIGALVTNNFVNAQDLKIMTTSNFQIGTLSSRSYAVRKQPIHAGWSGLARGLQQV